MSKFLTRYFEDTEKCYVGLMLGGSIQFLRADSHDHPVTDGASFDFLKSVEFRRLFQANAG